MKLNRNHPLYVEDLSRVLSIRGLKTLEGKKFLITGATGLIGTFLIDVLMYYNNVQNAQISIYAVARSRKKAEERMGMYYGHPCFHLIEQDVLERFPADLLVDYIIPLASNTHPMAYSLYPIETLMINLKGAEHALEKALQCGATVLYPSSVEIYGNARGEDVFTENYTGELNLSTARSCYTEAKRACEAMCLSYLAEKGVKVKIVRLCRVFGPTMQMSDTKASSQFIPKALAEEDIILKSAGNQYYSYIYMADAVCAMIHVLLHGEYGMAYNISNKKCNVHLKDFARICAETNGKNIVFDLPTETERKGFSVALQAVLDNSRLRECGFEPHYSMEDAIQRTIKICK